MQTTSHSRTRRLFSTIFKIREWLDVDRIQSGQRFIVDQCKTWFVPGKAQKVESFDSAIARLNLSEQDILTRQKGLFRLSLIMVSAASAMFIYSMYNLFYGYYLGLLVSVVVMLLALVMAFRYHFWYFQIKHHKLGCSLNEWFMQGILGAKDE